MKLPKFPPNYQDLNNRNLSKLGEILSIVTSPMHKSNYIHWDDLIYKRSLPPQLTPEEYWYGLKLRRNLFKKEISLRDKNQLPFSFLMMDNILKDLHQIDLHTAGNIGALYPTISTTQEKEKYLISSLIEEAITSSQIEGAITTRKVAKEMIRSGRKPRDVNERMILNNYITMRHIVEIKGEKLTPDLILSIHKLITDDTLEDKNASGRLRNASENIDVGDAISGETFHVPPDASELESRLKLMCQFANGENTSDFIHPVIRAIILHFWLAYDHPFVDGNGRTARALFYWYMLNNRYWLFEYISISQAIKDSKMKYYKSFLHCETDQNDLTYFILYHLEAINKSIKSLGAYLERKTRETKSIEYEMKSVAIFNHRQKALIIHALKNPSQTYSYNSHATSHNIARQTARTDILELQKLGLLMVNQSEKQLLFYPVNNFKEKLKEVGLK